MAIESAIAQHPDLIAQVLVSVVAEKQASILRYLDNVPALWQTRLAQQAQQQSVMRGVQFDIWLQYEISKASLNPWINQANAVASNVGPSENSLPAALTYWFSPVYLLQLSNIDTFETMQRALNRLSRLDVCSTTPVMAMALLAQEKTAWWNQAGMDFFVLVKRWKVAGDRALALELTHKVLQAKQRFQETSQWPQSLPNIDSNICKGEHWVYEHTQNNGITLSLSTVLHPEPLVPLYYRFEVE
ncbi:MAG: hypothetical protein HC800_17330 [Phormidesmis sp. RL_2_1]|nr:hypothetical protein [Phormidesmis sp. RL_2_1]